MKRISTFLLLAGLFFGCGQVVKAQTEVIDVCAGNDTVELHLGNYQYGHIQWQFSPDNENYEMIEGATDTVYRFLPEKNGYYRAEAILPSCSPSYSRVCHIQLPPKADGGPDRVLAEGTGATLYALLEENCVGEWKILQGENGMLSDPNDPNCYFSGTDSEYLLTWTVTNPGGSLTDTVRIRYVQTVYNENFAIVDTTDVILSDSTQMINGLYIVQFSDDLVHIQDSTILIGIGEQGFLRKVLRYEVNGNVYTMQTEEAALSDLIIQGAMSIDRSNFDISDGKRKVFYRYPTRKELMSEEAKNGKCIYLPQTDEVRAVMRDSGFNFEFGPIGLSVPGLPVAIVPNLFLEKNFLIDWEKDDRRLTMFKFGFYNGRLERELYMHVDACDLTVALDGDIKLPKSFNIPIYFTILFIPVNVTFVPTINYRLSGAIQIGVNMQYYQRDVIYFTRGITYRDGEWSYESSESEEHYKEFQYSLGTCSLELYVGPKITAKLYNCFEGPYLSAGPFINLVKTQVPNTSYRVGGGGRFLIGMNTRKFFGVKLGFSMNLDCPVAPMYENPKRLQMWQGNNQRYNAGETLPLALMVRALDSKSKSSCATQVRFVTSDGTVSEDYVETDPETGIAETNWTPVAGANGKAVAQAYLYDVNGAPVSGVPVEFKAYENESSSAECANSTLSVKLDNVEGRLAIDISGGRLPYTYSTDGSVFADTEPVFTNLVWGATYTVYVSDGQGCVAEDSYTMPSFSCVFNPPHVFVTQNGNSLIVEASDGTEPYEFSYDGEHYFESGVFNYLPNGRYEISVRDAMGCTDQVTINIEADDDLIVVFTLPAHNEGSAVTLRGDVFTTDETIITQRGFCYSTHHAPDLDDVVVECEPGSGPFSTTLTDLEMGRLYYVRAFAASDNGLGWGDEERVMLLSTTGNLVYNGDFELGNVGFESDYIYGNTGSHDHYYVGSDIANMWPWDSPGFPVKDHTSGEGLFMMVDGSIQPNTVVWSQTIPVVPHTDYLLSAWFLTDNIGYFKFEVNGVQIGFDLSSPQDRWVWEQYCQEWNSGENTEITLKIINRYSQSAGYDYCIDDIYFGPLQVPSTGSYQINASPMPLDGGTVTGTGVFEEGASCSLTATANAGFVFKNWTENNAVVSTESTYGFTVHASRNLVAHFDPSGSDPHTYVDLGLPSGLLWATCNVGADAPEEYGSYYAWGETSQKDNYKWETYQYCNGNLNNLTKYCASSSSGYNGYRDFLGILLPEDDAATVNWGSAWRMPTKEEWQELLDNTTSNWTTQNGVKGMLFTASNGHTLFLPDAGCYMNDLLLSGYHGYYYSSSLCMTTSWKAHGLDFKSNQCVLSEYGRDLGYSVRPVRCKNSVINVAASEGGEVSGGGTYMDHSNCNLVASPREGFYFVYWTENGEVVSTDASYTFVVSGNRNLVANFIAAFVDLGLPSGLLWANWNVGANAPWETGNYFAWGETQPKVCYDWNTYLYANGNYNELTKYCSYSFYGFENYTDNLTVLLPEDDVATVGWGEAWRMPTQEEWRELLDNTTQSWVTMNDVNGKLFTASNGRSLFLPVTGCWYNDALTGGSSIIGYYWSSSLDTSIPCNAIYLEWGSSYGYMNRGSRDEGYVVRPVRSAPKK